MPDVASVLKEEIARLARKEIKIQTEPLRKSSAAYRKEIAALKGRVSALERAAKNSERAAAAASSPQAEAGNAGALRFSAKGLRANRERLGLSQADFAKLIGVTPASVARWEQGGVRPRQSQLAAIASVRSIGKREARERLTK